MPTDRSRDRHQTDRHVISMRRKLWDELGEKVGPRRRSETIRDLVKRYLAGEAMPDLPEKN